MFAELYPYLCLLHCINYSLTLLHTYVLFDGGCKWFCVGSI